MISVTTVLPTHNEKSFCNVDDYNVASVIPDVCCHAGVEMKATSVMVVNTNLAVQEKWAHLVSWQCVKTEYHNGKGILLSDDI